MTPLQFLLLASGVTAIAAGVNYVLRQRQLRALRELAAAWNMHFSPTDRFRLAARIVPRLPVPGAAAVRVTDLLYAIEREQYRYIFLTEYTVGVLRTKHGLQRVATFCEPRDAPPQESIAAAAAPDGPLEFAPEELPLVQQNQHLLEKRGALKQ